MGRFGAIDDTMRLAGGVEMPRFGLGTYKTEPGPIAETAVATALDAGYRLVDTAALYGNEEDVGRAIRASGVVRGELFVTTKVWNDDQGAGRTARAIDTSLEKLGVDYIDLYLVHWAIPDLMHETWEQMEEAVRAGKIRAIGVCNHLEHHIDALLSQAAIAPAVNQFEFHVRLQQPGLIEYCREHEIVAQAWAPLMRGGVSEIPEIRRIADAHGVTPIQVAIRWVLQRGISVIPKSVQPERIRSNAEVYEFELSPEEVRDLDALDHGERMGRHPDNANA